MRRLKNAVNLMSFESVLQFAATSLSRAPLTAGYADGGAQLF